MKRSLTVAFGLLATLDVGGACAQSPPPLDVLGIQLGMSADQAVQIVNSHATELSAQNVKMAVEPMRIAYNAIPKPIVWGVRAAAIGNGPVPGETIIVVFTMPPNQQVVAEVHRYVQYGANNKPAKDILLASLRKKYGPESARQKDVTDINHSWLFKDGRQQFFSSQYGADALYLSSCNSAIEGYAITFGISDDSEKLNRILNQGFPADVMSKCGSRASAMTAFDHDLVSSFGVSIVDLAMEAAALEKTRTMLQNAAAAKHQEEIEKAKQFPAPKL